MANFFRLYLHASALNLLVRLRNQLPDPPSFEAAKQAADESSADESGSTQTATSESASSDAAASTPPARVSTASRLDTLLTADNGSSLRRATPASWRMRLIKVAAEVKVSARRVLIRLSGCWPHLPTFEAVLTRIAFS